MKNSKQNVTSKAGLYTILAVLVLAANPSMANTPDAVAVTVAPVMHEQRSQPIRNSGRISQKNEMRLAFKTGGLIEGINVEEGDKVISGQILATLDLEEINARPISKRTKTTWRDSASYTRSRWFHCKPNRTPSQPETVPRQNSKL